MVLFRLFKIQCIVFKDKKDSWMSPIMPMFLNNLKHFIIHVYFQIDSKTS